MNDFEYQLDRDQPDGFKVPEARTSFDFHALIKCEVAQALVSCPKFLTLARHVALEDVTPLHCIEANTLRKINLHVPKQALFTKIGKEGLRYTILRVFTELKKEELLLVVCERSRQGLLLPLDALDASGNAVVRTSMT